MAFGPIMRLQTNDLQLELAPLAKEDMQAFVSPGMQQASVMRYLEHTGAPVLEDELEWFERTRTEKDSLVWGIFVLNGSERKLIGNTALTHITYNHTVQAISGSMIFDKAYWGRGIASHIHKARTWYAFRHLGLTRIKSAVVHGNIGSLKALEKSGYSLVSVERNTQYVEGVLRHQDNLECLNPDESVWNWWWGEDQPPELTQAARVRTRDAMEWADAHVELS